jgi:hypothetical protein
MDVKLSKYNYDDLIVWSIRVQWWRPNGWDLFTYAYEDLTVMIYKS